MICISSINHIEFYFLLLKQDKPKMLKTN